MVKDEAFIQIYAHTIKKNLLAPTTIETNLGTINEVKVNIVRKMRQSCVDLRLSAHLPQ